MSELKSALIIFSVLCCLNLEIDASKLSSKPTLSTRFWYADYAYVPEIVKVNDSLFSVGFQDNTINITSVFDSRSKTCKISLHQGKIVANHVRAEALGNGKIVVATVVTSERRQITRDWDLYVIVNPHDCSSLKTVEIHDNYNRHLAAFVPYHDSFDLFYPEGVYYVPLRYNDQGEQIMLAYSLELKSDFVQVPKLKIQTIKPYDPSEGYVYAFRWFNNCTALRRLNSQFELVHDGSIVTDWINTMSAAYGNISECYIMHFMEDSFHDEDSAFCWLHNSEFKIRAIVPLSWLYGKNVADMMVHNLPDGDAIVAVVNKTDHPKGTGYWFEFFMQRIGPKRRTRKPVHVITFTSDSYRMKTILLDSGEFCLAAGTGKEVWTRCIDVKH